MCISAINSVLSTVFTCKGTRSEQLKSCSIVNFGLIWVNFGAALRHFMSGTLEIQKKKQEKLWTADNQTGCRVTDLSNSTDMSQIVLV